MDNLTHSMAGWALGQAGLKQKSRKGLAALILGANAPDIDVFSFWVACEPLATHRGFTHSLIGGVIILPAMLWGLLMLLDRWQVSQGKTFQSGLPMNSRWLLGLCYIGALTHPLLDLQTTYAVQLFSPLSGLWYHSDSLFIIDVWLWALLGLTIAWSRMGEKQKRAHWQRPVQYALLVAVVYISLNIGLSERAIADVRARHPRAEAIFASAEPVKSWQRRMSWRNDEAILRAPWRIIGGLRAEAPAVASNMDDPLVRRAIREDPALHQFLHWSVMPVARVTREGCRATVEVDDARYGLPGEGLRGPGVPETRLDLCQ